ncbi:helix-turn-helix domain-containing protein [Klebsiella pneumoniae]|nr:helix-turn-helix domain-containing protein [Klebsiella pneumoniae]
MKAVLIDEFIEFSEDGLFVRNISNNFQVELSIVQKDILKILIENNFKTVAREDILSNAFDKNNLNATEGNLNQQISSLRKIFFSLEGSKDLIVTLPKVGYKLCSGTLIQNIPLTDGLHVKSKNSKVQHQLYFGATVISIFLLLFILFHKRLAGNPYSQNIEIVDKCHVFNLRASSDATREPGASKVLKAFNIDCLSPKDVYVYNEYFNFHGANREIMGVAICDSNNSIKRCHNDYLNEDSE